MNIYEKLQKCRVELQNSVLKKSGHNKFSDYWYFELADFLPKVNELFFENKLCGIVKYGIEMVTLDIVNIEKPEETIQFTSPMSTAVLKGCNEVQNLGAVETYERRYLYVTALEITESDALDPITGKEELKKKKKELHKNHQQELPDRQKEPDEITFEPDRMETDGDSLSAGAFEKEVYARQRRSEFRAMLKHLAHGDPKEGEANLFRITGQTSMVTVTNEIVEEFFDTVKRKYEEAQTTN